MPEATLTLRNPTGLHARPAKIFALAAAEVTADVTVTKDGREVNGKSVLSVLTLDCHAGDRIVIRTDGEDAEAALEELVRLVESGLGE
jgi:phosphocarrier protein HPr